MRLVVLLSSVVLLTSGCATVIQTSPVSSANQEQIYRGGIPSLVSKGKFVVMASPEGLTRKSNEQPSFVVSVANTSGKPFDFDTTNITAQVDGKPIKVFTYEEVAAETKRKQAIAAALVAFGGALQAASAQQQASYQSTYGRYNSTTSGNFNSYGARNSFGNFNANTSGTYSGWTYNPAAGQAAASAVNAQTQSNLASLRAQGEASLSEAARVMLRRQTVSPGQAYGGRVVLAEIEVPEGGARLLIRVTIEDETHEFRFSQARQK